jgi:pyruvate formate lyase activating enzyme
MINAKLHEAMFYEKHGKNSVRCRLCSHYCTIAQDKWGTCGIRINKQGILYTTSFGRAISIVNDPIEKKPLFHFYPGSRSLSVATFGCNFKCTFCQNHSISQVRKRVYNTFTSPEEIVEIALKQKCKTISFTYTEPTVFYEYAYLIGIKAREQGIKNVFVTNGFMSPETIEHSRAFLDGANVDLKSFNEETYKKVSGGDLKSVLQSIDLLHKHKVWLEITTLVVPGLNDSDDELLKIAEFIGSISPEIPWHISRFHPDYNYHKVTTTSSGTLDRAYKIGKKAGLHYIFLGNVPGDSLESTYCPNCRTIIIERFGFQIGKNRIKGNLCPECGQRIPGFFG